MDPYNPHLTVVSIFFSILSLVPFGGPYNKDWSILGLGLY